MPGWDWLEGGSRPSFALLPSPRPFWLSPSQIMVIPVGPDAEEYAAEVRDEPPPQWLSQGGRELGEGIEIPGREADWGNLQTSESTWANGGDGERRPIWQASKSAGAEKTP